MDGGGEEARAVERNEKTREKQWISEEENKLEKEGQQETKVVKSTPRK